MGFLRRLLILTLALAVLLTGTESAVARSEMAGATVQVLCAEGTSQPMVFDATGKPLADRHACPHCLAAASPLALDLPPLALPRPLARALDLTPVLAAAPRPAATATRPPEARAPPLFAV